MGKAAELEWAHSSSIALYTNYLHQWMCEGDSEHFTCWVEQLACSHSAETLPVGTWLFRASHHITSSYVTLCHSGDEIWPNVTWHTAMPALCGTREATVHFCQGHRTQLPSIRKLQIFRFFHLPRYMCWDIFGLSLASKSEHFLCLCFFIYTTWTTTLFPWLHPNGMASITNKVHHR